MILRGVTAHYLARSTFPLKTRVTRRWYTQQAGGVGLLLVQIAQLAARAVRVIGTVSTEEKAKLRHVRRARVAVPFFIRKTILKLRPGG